MLTSLYIHIPFCQKICIYCDFNKEMAKPSKISNYINALIIELENQKEKLTHLETIFIGGGTPSYLPNQLLIKLLTKIQSIVDMNKIVEYTIETNPNDITELFVKTIKSFGINRVSMGVQTFDAKILQFLNRSHQPRDIKKAYNLLKTNGINNINLDMIFGLPFQTIEDLEKDLDNVLELNPSHISYYSLIWEENTTLYYLYNKGKVGITDEDLEAKMYNKVIDTLTNNEYNHYEISSFSKTGKSSMHNKAYWTMKEYLGIGSGAHSYVNKTRFYHTTNITNYINDITTGKHDKILDEDSNPQADSILMGLRLMDGFDIHLWQTNYHLDLFDTYPKIKEFIHSGLLKYENGKLSFTRKGLLLGNIVFEVFVEG